MQDACGQPFEHSTQMNSVLVRIAGFEIWVVGLLLTLSIANTAIQPVCILVAIGFWIVRWFAFGCLSLRTPVDWSVLGLVLLLPISLYIATTQQVAVQQVYRVLCGVLIFYAIVNWAKTREKFTKGLMVLALVGVTLSVYAFLTVEWRFAGLFGWLENIRSFTAPYLNDRVNPNVMAGNLVILMPVMAALAISSYAQSSRLAVVIAIISFVTMASVLLLTFSRSAWLALIVSMVALVLLRWRWGWAVVLLSVLATIGVYFYAGPLTINEFLLSGTSAGSTQNRLELWQRGIQLLNDFPFTGVGMGGFSYALALFFPLSAQASNTLPHVHNLFLQIGIDMGVPGLIFWLANFMLVVYSAWRFYQWGLNNLGRQHWMVYIAAGLLCSQVAMIVNGMTDSVTWGMVRPAPLVWIVWGFAVAMEIHKPRLLGDRIAS